MEEFTEYISTAWQNLDLLHPVMTSAEYMLHNSLDFAGRFGAGAAAGWIDGQRKESFVYSRPAGTVGLSALAEYGMNGIESLVGHENVTGDDAAGIAGFALGAFSGKVIDSVLDTLYARRHTPAKLQSPVVTRPPEEE